MISRSTPHKLMNSLLSGRIKRKVSEHDQEMPQSHTTDQLTTLRGKVKER